MRTLWTHDNSKTQEELAVINANHMAQNLYDHLTCAGLRCGMWPDSDSASDLDEAFASIEEYIDALASSATKEVNR